MESALYRSLNSQPDRVNVKQFCIVDSVTRISLIVDYRDLVHTWLARNHYVNAKEVNGESYNFVDNKMVIYWFHPYREGCLGTFLFQHFHLNMNMSEIASTKHRTNLCYIECYSIWHILTQMINITRCSVYIYRIYIT